MQSKTTAHAARRRPEMQEQVDNPFAVKLLKKLVVRETKRQLRGTSIDVDASEKLEKLQKQAAQQKMQVIEVKDEVRVLKEEDEGDADERRPMEGLVDVALLEEGASPTSPADEADAFACEGPQARLEKALSGRAPLNLYTVLVRCAIRSGQLPLVERLFEFARTITTK